MLLRGYDTLSDDGKKRLDVVFATDDLSQELVAAWGVKEALRLMLSTSNPASLEDRKAFFERQVKAAAMKETDQLQKTVTKWWPEIQTLLATRVTTGKLEAANTMIRNIKRIARGFVQPNQLSITYPAMKCRPDGGMNSSQRAGIHHETQRAA